MSSSDDYSDDCYSDSYRCKKCIVVDFGSFETRIGINRDDAPRAVFPTVIGKPMHRGVMVGMGQKDAYCGDEAMAKKDILNLKYPIQNGHVSKWDLVRKVLHFAIYDELREQPEDSPILIVDFPQGSEADRKELCRIMFDDLMSPAVCIQSAAVLSMYELGLQSGVVVDIGHSGTRVSLVVDGKLVSHKFTASPEHAVREAFARLPASARNVVIIGGKSMAGIPDSLTAGLPSHKLHVNEHRKYLPWIGGAKFSRQADFTSKCLTQ
eukprot:gnl/Dysnectes_brevis/2357_a2782_1451.p1 GENE.gnl/Dysnectes_brevis/2357_a2782_1451~~gnl/Dysnectes_brevis/2357_a2782_1451.p1  ORF type:complete len:266 (-),score=63.02 gnl/Dysnectes_brevis/2357_a2782_1451:118-915(-)